jgi:hypothetical protein
MAADVVPALRTAEDLSPPPRALSLRLWCRLVAGPLPLGGSAAFAFTMVFVMIFVPATDPAGTWRLARRHQEARGWLEGMQATNFHEGGGEGEEGTPIYRYDYTFLLPDGVPARGHSYAVGQQFRLPPQAPGQPFPRVPVTVEYDPQDPGTSRIQGTRTSPYTPWVLLVLLFPAAALVAVLVGLSSGLRRARLLRDGEVVPAAVTGCQFGAGDCTVSVSPAEYRKRLAEAAGRVAGHPVITFATGFVAVWTLMAAAFLVLGTIFCVAMLVLVLFVFPAPAQGRLPFALGVGGFLVLWVVMGLFMVRNGWHSLSALRGRVPVQPPPVPCTFEFRLPDGERVEARSAGRIGDGSVPEPPQPALYDPARSDNALLLSGLEPEVRVGESGGWETSAGALSLLRLPLALGLLGGPVIVWAVL